MFLNLTQEQVAGVVVFFVQPWARIDQEENWLDAPFWFARVQKTAKGARELGLEARE